MDPIVTPIVCGVLAITGGVGGLFYLPDREGWHKIVKRTTAIVRSHLGGPPIQTVVIRKRVSDNGLLEEFDAVLEGKAESLSSSREIALVQPKLHTIERSWNTLKDGGEGVDDIVEQWWWKCRCGESKWRKTKEGSKEAARLHIKTFGNRDKNDVKEEGWFKERWEKSL